MLRCLVCDKQITEQQCERGQVVADKNSTPRKPIHRWCLGKEIKALKKDNSNE